MTEVGKYGKQQGIPSPSDMKRALAMPDKATPRKSGFHPTKPYGYSYRYASLFSRKRKTFHRWFKTKCARDQSIAVMRRDDDIGGRPFYTGITEINPGDALCKR